MFDPPLRRQDAVIVMIGGRWERRLSCGVRGGVLATVTPAPAKTLVDQG